jgi:homogentisate 1,2-dioxygenase
MPIYHTLGTIPPKRHTVFRKPDGNLYAEELVSTEGFRVYIHWFIIVTHQQL